MNKNLRKETVVFLRNLVSQRNQANSEYRKPKNIVIWCGAGFSKSWNQNSPTDGALFQIENSEFLQFPNLCRVLDALGWRDNDRIGFEGFKTLSYIIGMMIRYQDIRNQYIDSHTLQMSVRELRYFIENKFSNLCKYQEFDKSTSNFVVEKNKLEEQKNVLDFFGKLINENNLKITNNVDFISTNYDYTIEAILDKLQPDGESIVSCLYRGVTPKTICGISCPTKPGLSYKHTLIKLNGGFEILRKGQNYHLMYTRREQEEKKYWPPIVMLPNREQDYSDSYFGEIFPKAVRLLREADVLIVVGYSMPWEDVLLRFILHQFAESDREAIGKHLVCVDFKGPEILQSRLLWTFGSIKTSGWPRIHFFPGAFVEFCEEFACG